MTDAVAIALIAGGFGTMNVTVAAVGRIISRKVQEAARISMANHETLTKVVANTDGNVTKLQEAWAEEARRRETAAWQAAFEAGRRAEMEKKRRATDVLDEPEPVNDDEPKEE